MKIATVNPIPAALDIAMNVGRREPSGNSAIPARTPRSEKRAIPRGFPITSPKKIPHATAEDAAVLRFWPEREIPEFAKAKSGTMMKLVSG